jgi:DNA repair photolyase
LRRLRTIPTLAEADIPAGVRIAPIISFVTKPEIERMRGDGVWADFIRQRFRKTVDRLGMNLRGGRFKTLDASCFRRPLFIPSPPSKQCNIATGRLDFF